MTSLSTPISKFVAVLITQIAKQLKISNIAIGTASFVLQTVCKHTIFQSRYTKSLLITPTQEFARLFHFIGN